MLLGVNIDHVATLRQARYAMLPDSPNAEPSVAGGGAGREGGRGGLDHDPRAGDRRHMQDRGRVRHCGTDVALPLNLEWG